MAEAHSSNSAAGTSPTSVVTDLQQQVQQQLKYIQNQRQQLQDLRDRIGHLERLLPYVQYLP